MQNSTKSKKLEVKKKYTIKDLADKTGIKYYTLLKYEQGVQGIPTADLKRLADAFSIKAGTLFPRRKVLGVWSQSVMVWI
ncbi:helix-turn-helix domain-containing protein [Wolbachia endosymbiont (group A) of Volucella inflata]|uniref:helix-turn-helix domain-containing protein n=1 Tax=Wolbachia endosymbiont (group A) of Volucella inflata TaxID=2954065 RepID=UPI0029D40E38|nr:helix-turn-helix transcriptional regulator [Wolbachia endosymbiont (group A) of Volucella inflata]